MTKVCEIQNVSVIFSYLKFQSAAFKQTVQQFALEESYIQTTFYAFMGLLNEQVVTHSVA